MRSYMPRVKKVSATVVTKEKPSDPFRHALDAACKRLEMAIDERTLCYNKLAHLEVEIPSLERTVTALKEQLNPRKQAMNPTPNTVPRQPQAVVQNMLEDGSAEAELRRITAPNPMHMPVNVPQPVPPPMKKSEVEMLRNIVMSDGEGPY